MGTHLCKHQPTSTNNQPQIPSVGSAITRRNVYAVRNVHINAPKELSARELSFTAILFSNMTEGTETPPGLEALADHLGYTFVKKETPSSTNSTADSSSENPESSKSSSTEEKETEDEDKEKPKDDVSPGSLTSFAKIYRKNAEESWTAKIPEDTEPAEGENTIGHAVVLRQQKSLDSRKGYEIHSIVIQSSALKAALGEVLNDYPGVFCNLDRLVFKAPFAPFIHRWGAFLEYLEKDDLDSVTKDHMILLRDILQEELADTIKALKDYVRNGVVTYEHAWTIFQPGSVILSASGVGEKVALRLKSASYEKTDQDGNFLGLKCQCVNWNGRTFGWSEEFVKLSEFEGIQQINDLSVLPLAFHPKKEQLKQMLTERGKRFAALSGYHYRRFVINTSI